MIGKRQQPGLFEADQMYMDYVGRETIYGFLAGLRGELFRDEDFAEMYCPDNGRPSVAPSLLANALILQTYERVSDEDAKARADYDLRWKVALGVEVDERPFAKSTLQLFRAQLVVNEKKRMIFQRSLEYAKQVGYMKKGKLREVLDTSKILGRGAVKDTYNLLADGIVQLIRWLAAIEEIAPEKWGEAQGFERYFGSSIKGEAEIDWDNQESRDEFLKGIVEDADRLLKLADESVALLEEGDKIRQRVHEAGSLLRQIISQDVERTPEKISIKEGTAKDRIVSVHDPEMRHGHKSKSNLFEGHKAAIAVDAESQLITAVGVLAGNAPDHEGALDLTEASEENTGQEVEETIGDCAYGDGGTRQKYADANRKLIAKVARHGRRDQINKEEFQIDLETMTCTCPNGQVTSNLVPQGMYKDAFGEKIRGQAFVFDKIQCEVCPILSDCIKAKKRKHRTVQLHPQEKLLQEARAFQQSEAFKEYRRLRQSVEHRLARLVQLGIRQARYFGRRKTLFQLLMAATVANLTLAATKTGQIRTKGGRRDSFCAWILGYLNTYWMHLTHFLSVFASTGRQIPTFRLRF
jgi:transposase